MQKFDLQMFSESVNSLAEALDRKSLGARAIEIWFETLREFPTQRVMATLKVWAKTHAKFPAPADVWKVMNDTGIDSREQEAKTEKARIKREIEQMPRSEYGAQVLQKIAEILKRPKRTTIEHWQNVLETPGLPQISYEYANLALSRLQPKRNETRDREPGEDWEEEAA